METMQNLVYLFASFQCIYTTQVVENNNIPPSLQFPVSTTGLKEVHVNAGQIICLYYYCNGINMDKAIWCPVLSWTMAWDDGLPPAANLMQCCLYAFSDGVIVMSL